jgi:hypothetical protein
MTRPKYRDASALTRIRTPKAKPYTFAETSFAPGALVRFRETKSERWTYAIYRGTGEHIARGGFEFSHQPLGPITIWLANWPSLIQTAVIPHGINGITTDRKATNP